MTTLYSKSVGARNIISGHTLHIDDFEEGVKNITEDTILIIPNLSVDYEMVVFEALKKAKIGVIAETGSRTSHLSIIARELGFTIFIEKDAIKKFKESKLVTLNPFESEITILSF